jgi:pantoate kinase
MDRARAFAPGNISCVFKVIPHKEPEKMHSLGMGLTVSEGVEVDALHAVETSVSFNGEDIEFPTVISAVKQLTSTDLRLEIASPLPLSCGFGLSGASSLAAVYAVNALLDLGKEEEELALIAHVAEVENLTGLGDVCAQYHGGCLVKLKEGSPLEAQRLAVREQSIYYRYFSPILTSEVIGNAQQRARINAAADTALQGLKKFATLDAVDFEECIAVSKEFAVASGLLQDRQVQEVIATIEAEGGAASMIMLGNAVFSTRPFADAAETVLTRHKVRVL